MRIEFLGTGGTATTPKPGCRCRICTEARDKGVPYSRTGPSIFIHGPDIIIDTPEEIKYQLNRADIGSINGCFYSHWHPDHVMGRDIAILPMGIVEFHPITGERLIDNNHPVLNIEATFNDTLDIINKLSAKEVILTLIEEMDGLSYSDLLEVQKSYNAKGYNISFAYDTQIIDV